MAASALARSAALTGPNSIGTAGELARRIVPHERVVGGRVEAGGLEPRRQLHARHV
jgi:hypothetical protein